MAEAAANDAGFNECFALFPAGTAVFRLTIPENSIESLDES